MAVFHGHCCSFILLSVAGVCGRDGDRDGVVVVVVVGDGCSGEEEGRGRERREG